MTNHARVIFNQSQKCGYLACAVFMASRSEESSVRYTQSHHSNRHIPPDPNVTTTLSETEPQDAKGHHEESWRDRKRKRKRSGLSGLPSLQRLNFIQSCVKLPFSCSIANRGSIACHVKERVKPTEVVPHLTISRPCLSRSYLSRNNPPLLYKVWLS
ncbi:uncharacterized protein LY79DRAFT_534173 [Colletotrichum navitas]|uniref:Uncharacterized protein n=1 Tax=Colletotrichum navitas TaxID=681940 RepID=A0AAD8QG88_9PEZI|nr:uncharacterized protein LY79DRAFT_534173 [Colletotrichum navitas]KAK1600614.1 hypothetical protein LY79DRAFT_534173 [Colletotrichum navitas]